MSQGKESKTLPAGDPILYNENPNTLTHAWTHTQFQEGHGGF